MIIGKIKLTLDDFKKWKADNPDIDFVALFECNARIVFVYIKQEKKQ